MSLNVYFLAYEAHIDALLRLRTVLIVCKIEGDHDVEKPRTASDDVWHFDHLSKVQWNLNSQMIYEIGWGSYDFMNFAVYDVINMTDNKYRLCRKCYLIGEMKAFQIKRTNEEPNISATYYFHVA